MCTTLRALFCACSLFLISCSGDNLAVNSTAFVDHGDQVRSTSFSSIRVSISGLDLLWLPSSATSTGAIEFHDHIQTSPTSFLNDTLTLADGPIEYQTGHYTRVVLIDSNRLFCTIHEYSGGASGNTSELFQLGPLTYEYEETSGIISIPKSTFEAQLSSLYYRQTYFESHGTSWRNEASGADTADDHFDFLLEIRP